MPDTMIERMAVAIAAEYGWKWIELPDSNPVANGEHDKAMYRNMARAALAAMRAPTEVMVLAGMLPDGEATSAEVWPAMIDAAIAETQDA